MRWWWVIGMVLWGALLCMAQQPTDPYSKANAADSLLSQRPLLPQDSLTLVSDSIAMVSDTIEKGKDWKEEFKHLRINIDDTITEYPQFIDFVFGVARWVRQALYTYDTTYVQSFDNRWRFTVKNNNWFDSYSGHLTEDKIPIRMASNITTKFGAHVSYKGYGLGYMLNLKDVFTGRRLDNRRWDGSINTSRLSLEWYFSKDRSDINVHRLGDFGKNSWRTYEFDGLTREAYGVLAYYFFNHRHFCQPAAYGMSRIQLRSAGSFILGAHITHQDIFMDFKEMDDEMWQYVPTEMRECRFRYRDLCVVAGYGYNWVPRRRWLINVTAIPSIGWRYSFNNSIEGERHMLSTNIRLKIAWVINRDKWSYGLNIISDGHWYRSKSHSFFNSSQDINIAVGFRI